MRRQRRRRRRRTNRASLASVKYAGGIDDRPARRSHVHSGRTHAGREYSRCDAPRPNAGPTAPTTRAARRRRSDRPVGRSRILLVSRLRGRDSPRPRRRLPVHHVSDGDGRKQVMTGTFADGALRRGGAAFLSAYALSLADTVAVNALNC